MTEKKSVFKKEIDWQAFWEDPMWPSEEEEGEFRELFRINRRSLQVPFGSIDGSGNRENVR